MGEAVAEPSASFDAELGFLAAFAAATASAVVAAAAAAVAAVVLVVDVLEARAEGEGERPDVAGGHSSFPLVACTEDEGTVPSSEGGDGCLVSGDGSALEELLPLLELAGGTGVSSFSREGQRPCNFFFKTILVAAAWNFVCLCTTGAWRPRHHSKTVSSVAPGVSLRKEELFVEK